MSRQAAVEIEAAGAHPGLVGRARLAAGGSSAGTGELAVGHALDRHHDPAVALLDARARVAELPREPLLPQRDRLEHVVVGADQRTLGHDYSFLCHGAVGTTPPSTIVPRTAIGVRMNGFALAACDAP